MKALHLLLLISVLPLIAFADGWRFTIPGQLLDDEGSSASPGSVPVTIATNGNVEILDWSTALTPTPERAEFVLKLRQPVHAATLAYYGAGEVSSGLSNEWKQIAAAEDKDHLSILAFASPFDALRITRSPVRQPDNSGYRATLPFLTVFPVPATNVARAATITASSGRVELLCDRLLETNALFRAAPSKGQSNAWIVFRWPKTELVRGIGFFGGPDSTPLVEAQIQYAAQQDGQERWLNMDGRPTEPGRFRSNQFFIASQQLNTTGVRLTQRKAAKELVFSEIVVLQDMRPSPAPEKRAARSN